MPLLDDKDLIFVLAALMYNELQGYMEVSKKLIWILNKVALAEKSSFATDYA